MSLIERIADGNEADWSPWQGIEPDGGKQVEPRAMMVGRDDGAAEGEPFEHNAQVALSAFEICAIEPQSEAQGKQTPHAPVPDPSPQSYLARDKEVGGGDEEDEIEASGALGEDCKEDIEREEALVMVMWPDHRLWLNVEIVGTERQIEQLPEIVERKDDPEAEQHLHAEVDGHGKLKGTGAEHEAGKATRLTAILEAHAAKVKLHDPSVHHPDDDKGRHKRKQAYRPHVVVEKQRLPHPEEPDIQWLHIGIRYILIGECQPVVLGNGFVGNTDIAQLVAWREVTQDERWESCYQEWYVLLQKMEKTHETDD